VEQEVPIDRRKFLQILGGSAASVYAFDPDKLLWVPGQKSIFIPPPRQLIYAGEVYASDYIKGMYLDMMSNFIASAGKIYEVEEARTYKHETGTYKTIQIYLNYMPEAPCSSVETKRKRSSII
jgi:hypothetical protein